MKSINSYILILALLLTSCVGGGRNMRQDTAPQAGEQRGTVAWEAEPRAIASGSGPQLGVRVSEGIYLLHAAPNADGKQDLFFSTSHTIGDNFSKPIRVNTEAGEVSAHGENDPQMRLGKNGEILVLWEGDKNIKFARSVNFGKSFARAIQINDDAEKATHSFLNMEVAPSGAIFAIWLDGRNRKTDAPGTSSIYIARSTDKGESFGKNVKISGSICPCCRPSIAFGEAGEVFAAWRHVFANNERIVVVATSLDGGMTWSDPVRVTPTGWKINGCAHSGPTLGYAGGKLVVAWYTAENGRAAVKIARSADKGKTFGAAEEIQGQVLDANHPHLTAVENEPWVVFQGRDPGVAQGWGPPKTWLTRIPSDGGEAKPEPLPSTGKGVFYPRLFTGNGGRLYAAWTEIADEGERVILCRGRIHF